jgi:chromate reductase, NAD(P)H dehydrogenase (quinone)
MELSFLSHILPFETGRNVPVCWLMLPTPKLLAFGGSLRRDSFNQKLAAAVAEGAREAGAEVTVIALRDYPLPVFDADLEQADGMPESARQLKQLCRQHDGFIIASPEYNSSITAALKNTLDWISRAESEEEPDSDVFKTKTAVLCSASPGFLGGLRSQVHVRAILGNLGVLVLPDQLMVSKAHEAFSLDGTLKDARISERARALGAALAVKTQKLLA